MEKFFSRQSQPVRLNRFNTLAWRIFFWMSFIAMVPLIIMAYQGYHCARQAVVESRESHLQSILESRKIQFMGWVSEMEGDLRFLAAAPCVKGDCCSMHKQTQTALSEESCNLLQQKQNGRSYYKNIQMLDSRFSVIRNQFGHEQKSGGVLPVHFLNKLKTAKAFIFSAVIIMENNERIMYAGIPVSDEQGDITGYIVATIDFDAQASIILNNRNGLGKTGTCFLLTPEQRSAEYNEITMNHVNSGNKNAVTQSSADEAVAAEYTNLKGNEVIGMATALPGLNMTLVLEMDQSEVFNWLRILRFRALLTGTITLLLIVAIAMKRAEILSRPLKALADVARKIANGAHGERMKSFGGIEAREVASAFNKMMDELQASERKLMHTASLAAVGELSSSIVHEMRNPLSSVKMNVQALRKKVADDPAYAELAEIAGHQAERLEEMLSDLLNYGKPIQLNVSETRFDDIMREVLALMRQDIEHKMITVEINNNLDTESFPADPEQLKRVITNILDNAVRITPPQKTITVTALNKHNKIFISVKDSGPGIAESALENLFKPFFTTRDSGTGLGLANVKKIVEYHGGSVSAQNFENGGAEFIIELPVEGPPA